MATLAIGLIAYYMISNRNSAKSTKDNFYLHSDHYVVSCRKCSCYNMLLTKKSSWKAFYDIAKFYEVKKVERMRIFKDRDLSWSALLSTWP